MDHFYVTLPSNSSEQMYGRQPMSSFKTHLAQQVSLQINDWEVGLVEIIYPHTWNNITDGSFKCRMVENTEWVWKDVCVPEAHYESPQQLVDIMNVTVKKTLGREQEDKILFLYNHLQRKLLVWVAEGYMVKLPPYLSTALGFGDEQTVLRHSPNEDKHGVEEKERRRRVVHDGDKIEAPMVVDLERGLHTFFVYCDLVEHQLVGDVNAPLLRTVAVSGRNGSVVAESFQNIHYVSLSRSTFQDIHIYITDDTGVRVPFQHGRVIVKLHFRRK